MGFNKKLPFREILSDNYSTRIFSENTKETELKWHFDNEDREITFLHDSDWKFQMDNDLPIEITKGLKLFIPEGEYHRILKGTGDLKVRVRKLNKTRLLPHTPKVK
jgi:hypothetical protein